MVALNNRGYLSLRAVVKSYRIHLLEIHGERCNLVYKRIVQFEKTGNIMEIAVVARTIASCSISWVESFVEIRASAVPRGKRSDL